MEVESVLGRVDQHAKDRDIGDQVAAGKTLTIDYGTPASRQNTG
jgi:hypothetical protein